MQDYKTDNDFSIIAQVSRTYDEFFEAPPIEYPIVEAVTRSDYSHLPDGSDYDDRFSAPIGETLDKAIYRISLEANRAWKIWIQCLLEEETALQDSSDKETKPATIEDILLDSSEKKHYLRIKRLRLLDDAYFDKYEIHRVSLILDEVVWQSNSGIDTQIPVLKRHTSAPSLKERNYFATLSNYNTNIWRKSASSYLEDNYYPNIGMRDDPDFIPPCNISSRNFAMYPPASRPYNITFSLTLEDGTQKLLFPNLEKAKDYTSLSSIRYMLDQKGVKYKSVSIHEKALVSRSNNFVQYVKCCSFEPDIRVTYGPDLYPDPVSYKKVDTDTSLGKYLLQKLNEQPHLFNDCVVDDPDGVDDIKKLIVYYTVKPSKDDPFGPRVYWTYVDSNTYPIASRTKDDRIRFLMPKTVFPSITYTPTKDRKPYTASFRISKDAYYRHNVTGRWISYAEIVDTSIIKLLVKGYVLSNVSREVLNDSVFVHTFIHKTAMSRKERKKNKLFLQVTS